jgi:hypothetical protein
VIDAGQVRTTLDKVLGPFNAKSYERAQPHLGTARAGQIGDGRLLKGEGWFGHSACASHGYRLRKSVGCNPPDACSDILSRDCIVALLLAGTIVLSPLLELKSTGNGGEERLMQQIRACTHDGTGAKPVIRARLLVRIIFSSSVSQRASLILSLRPKKMSKSQHADHGARYNKKEIEF